MSRVHLDDIYTDVFFEDNVVINNEFAAYFAPRVANLLRPRSIIDLGCARGVYLKYFNMTDVTAVGIEGSSAAVDNPMPGVFIIQHDLRDPLPRFRELFDIAMSFEVVEHIEPKYENVFIRSLTGMIAPYIIMSAAPPGQGGEHHVNCKPRDYWIKTIEAKNYEYSPKITEVLSRWGREAKQKGIRVPLWYPQNLMVFRYTYGCVV